jgi:uncharacterized membrane protein YheB (UPF0754 family)
MDEAWQWLVFPLVGAGIGALTNELAIRMLFRPYRPHYLFGWRLPFTPGVIPRQRHIIARNIASTFESQLLSGEEIHAILTGEHSRRLVEAKVDEMLAWLGPFAALAAGLKGKIVERWILGIEDMAKDLSRSGGELDIARRIEAKIEAMDVARLEELVLGFSRRQFQHITLSGGLLGFCIGLIQALIATLWG